MPSLKLQCSQLAKNRVAVDGMDILVVMQRWLAAAEQERYAAQPSVGT